MKVNIGKEFYVVHWRKRQFQPKYGNKFGLKLDETTCIIKTLDPVSGDTNTISEYTVRQNICDQSNNVVARKLSFTGAINRFFVEAHRCIFWAEYKKTMRLVPKTWRTKHSELKHKFDNLEIEFDNLKIEFDKIQKERTAFKELASSMDSQYR